MPDSYVQALPIEGHPFGLAMTAVSSPRSTASAAVATGQKSEGRRSRRRSICELATAASPSLYYDRSHKPLENYCFDEDYLRRLTEGEPSVEAHFAAYFGALLMLKLRNRLRSAQAIEDVRQETFLRVLETLRHKSGLEHPERLGAFVNSVCNNVLQESYRSQSRYTPLPEERTEPIDRTIDLEGDLVSGDRKRLVEKVLDRLPATDREILKMLFYEEINKQEICRVMGVNRDYLRVLVYRARLHFKAALQKVEAVVP